MDGEGLWMGWGWKGCLCGKRRVVRFICERNYLLLYVYDLEVCVSVFACMIIQAYLCVCLCAYVYVDMFMNVIY